MTKNDVVNLFRLICVLFPQSAKNFSAADELTRDVWHSMLADEPTAMVSAALKKHAATNRFAPSIAEILEGIAGIKRPELIDADEAWGLVMNAIHMYGCYRKSEALASLPPIVASTVRTFGWRELCTSENIAVDRGQFRRAYEIRRNREREKAALPKALLDESARLTNNTQMLNAPDEISR